MKALRERILISGARVLSDAELLAVVLREGTDALSAIELAERILDEFSPPHPTFLDVRSEGGAPHADAGSGALAALAAAEVSRVRAVAGCGAVRAVSIAAAAEFARRVHSCRAEDVSAIASKEDVSRLFAPLADLAHEEFWMLCLTSSGRIVDRTRVSQGGVSGTVVDHRLMIKRALELLASGIVLVHNHPSGSAAPSSEDIAVTEKVAAAAALFDIAVIDHLIVSREGSFSFAENGYLA